jgi:hypothetical protein
VLPGLFLQPTAAVGPSGTPAAHPLPGLKTRAGRCLRAAVPLPVVIPLILYLYMVVVVEPPPALWTSPVFSIPARTCMRANPVPRSGWNSVRGWEQVRRAAPPCGQAGTC